ncbi:interleukin-1 beta [Betta splendens]|uniref:Interleukin-1 n=1 Tax=Betta splendens TaxID=158456 RepID=A0A6P7P4H5_BETSP|nr:interleukin-1 beta [Betta splendens]
MDFDLSQALDGPSDLDETELNSRCFNDVDVQDKVIRIDEGLDLRVSSCKPDMARVVSLMLAVGRWRTWSQLSGDELCRTIMQNLVEETVVESPASTCTRQTSASYTRMKSEECTLCDAHQKSVILSSGRLEAITLKGDYDDLKVKFSVGRYMSPRDSEPTVVVLSIKNSDLHISCSMEGDKAVLSLEECNKETLKQISNESRKRFLFYKRAQAVSLTTFESVMCSDWFISTSPDGDEQPLEMCNDEACRLTSFRVI